MSGVTVEPRWRGERVFVVAGGQSVTRSLTADHLCGRRQLPGKVIAVKDAVFLLPWSDIMFYSGARLHKERPDLFESFKGPEVWKRAVDDGVPPYVHEVVRQKPKAGYINGLSLKPDRLGGYCSGGSAINLAFHLGAAEIVLVGFDLQGQHWNARGHPFPNAAQAVHDRHRAAIDAMAEPLAAAGVRVFNVSPSSTLRGFERAPFSHFAG